MVKVEGYTRVAVKEKVGLTKMKVENVYLSLAGTGKR